jgi:hypothetical protein
MRTGVECQAGVEAGSELTLGLDPHIVGLFIAIGSSQLSIRSASSCVPNY